MTCSTFQILDDDNNLDAIQSQFGSVYKENDFMIFKTQCAHPESVVSAVNQAIMQGLELLSKRLESNCKSN